jgi:hypothetical protein
MKAMLVVGAMICVPLAMAANKVVYPKENVAEFVVQKLDMTSLPAVYRPKKEKGKKTLADYGFTPQRMDQNEALIETPGGAHRLSITILEEGASGIYACFAEPAQGGGNPEAQSVVLLKSKDSNALLTGRTSSREFSTCPVIGTGSEEDLTNY